MSAVGTCKSAGIKTEPRTLLRARCEVDGYGRDCRILDINPRRVFVESFVPAPTGSRVKLNFSLPNGHQVCTAGVVSYHQMKVGFSVDFTDLSAGDRAQINSFVG
jgi:hypothetical protein